MLHIIIRAKWRHIGETGVWLGYHLLGSLLPIWLSGFIFAFVAQPVSLADFLDKGEFAIYAAAMITPVIYALTWENPGKEKAFYSLVTIICLIVASCIFILTIFPTFEWITIETRKANLRIASVAIYLISLLAAVLWRVYDNVYTELDIGEERDATLNSLDLEFEKEMGKQ